MRLRKEKRLERSVVLSDAVKVSGDDDRIYKSFTYNKLSINTCSPFIHSSNSFFTAFLPYYSLARYSH